MAQGCKCVIINVTGCGFDLRLEEIEYLIISFVHSGSKTKKVWL